MSFEGITKTVIKSEPITFRSHGQTPTSSLLQRSMKLKLFFTSNHTLSTQTPRQHPDSTPAAPGQHPGSTLAVPRQYPGSTTAAPKQHPSSTPAAPRQHPSSSTISHLGSFSACEAFSFKFFIPIVVSRCQKLETSQTWPARG